MTHNENSNTRSGKRRGAHHLALYSRPRSRASCTAARSSARTSSVASASVAPSSMPASRQRRAGTKGFQNQATIIWLSGMVPAPVQEVSPSTREGWPEVAPSLRLRPHGGRLLLPTPRPTMVRQLAPAPAAVGIKFTAAAMHRPFRRRPPRPAPPAAPPGRGLLRCRARVTFGRTPARRRAATARCGAAPRERSASSSMSTARIGAAALLT